MKVIETLNKLLLTLNSQSPELSESPDRGSLLYSLGNLWRGIDTDYSPVDKSLHSFISQEMGFPFPNTDLAAQCFVEGAKLGDVYCAAEAAYFSLLKLSEKNQEITQIDYEQAAEWSLQSVCDESQDTIPLFDRHHLYFIMKKLNAEIPHKAAQKKWEFNLDRLSSDDKLTIFPWIVIELNKTVPIRQLDFRNLPIPDAKKQIETLQCFANIMGLMEIRSQWMISARMWDKYLELVKLNPSIVNFSANKEYCEELKQESFEKALKENKICSPDHLKAVNQLRQEKKLSPVLLRPLSLKNLILYNKKSDNQFQFDFPDADVLPESLLQEFKNRSRANRFSLMS